VVKAFNSFKPGAANRSKAVTSHVLDTCLSPMRFSIKSISRLKIRRSLQSINSYKLITSPEELLLDLAKRPSAIVIRKRPHEDDPDELARLNERVKTLRKVSEDWKAQEGKVGDRT
jgi:hypothetical protein